MTNQIAFADPATPHPSFPGWWQARVWIYGGWVACPAETREAANAAAESLLSHYAPRG